MRDDTSLPNVDLKEPNSRRAIVAGLASHGIVLLRGGNGRESLIRAGRSLLTIRLHRDSDDDGVTTIVQRPVPEGSSVTGFSDRALWPHTDGSAVERPPRVLMLGCIQPAQAGGHSHVVDGRTLYDEIARTDLAMLTALSTPRSAYFGGGLGHLGAVFQEIENDRMAIRIRFDALARFSPVVTPYIGRLRALAQDRTITLDLREGDGYVVLNDRWLHGRSQFSGERTMLRIVGDPHSYLGLRSGFQPTVTGAGPLRAA
ncbi:TauD/TfdA family dioxygenase [Phytohabitans suffuscus]|uniref:TauD/TfdA-like domain-containing protein n=1 Tax=Phytohabitans suffuscus TaxID=624315 RepID=A0A6F8YKJ9_9ACTN|nr:TauD/TfdA family dioxygenase [Phytohabitans suffuscus]BCB86596.1 hypothetical protein Psuf_039090 [Phytohabitans suffuscus]